MNIPIRVTINVRTSTIVGRFSLNSLFITIFIKDNLIRKNFKGFDPFFLNNSRKMWIRFTTTAIWVQR